MIYGIAEGWQQFVQNLYNFFIKPDASGISYLARIGFAIAIIIVAWIVIKFICFLLKKMMHIKTKGPEIDISAKFFIIQAIKVLLWILVAFLVISVLKIEVTGIAGVFSAVTVALGLALQDVISCFAYGILILQQKHFVTGDYISVHNSFGTCEGTVTSVKLFFTHLNSIYGQVITVPNTNMAKAVITNYTRLGKRRTEFIVGVSYNADIAKAKKLLEDIAKSDPRVMQEEPIEVNVCELAPYAVNVRLRCWTKTDVYWPFFNELSEKVLLTYRDNGIHIPCSTEISVAQKEN